jgi:glutaredoxin
MKVHLYKTQYCSKCPAVIKYLNNKRVDFEVIDCTNDVNDLTPASEISGQFTVPQTKIGREVIVGLDYGKLADALRKNGLIE